MFRLKSNYSVNLDIFIEFFFHIIVLIFRGWVVVTPRVDGLVDGMSPLLFFKSKGMVVGMRLGVWRVDNIKL